MLSFVPTLLLALWVPVEQKHYGVDDRLSPEHNKFMALHNAIVKHFGYPTRHKYLFDLAEEALLAPHQPIQLQSLCSHP